MALVQRTGGGTGFSFSRLRPKSDPVSSSGGKAAGAVAFMKIFDCVTSHIKQGGKRRGANMGVLRVDHPDILDFIRTKKNSRELKNFNLSVAVPNSFMKAVMGNEPYNLIRSFSALACLKKIKPLTHCRGHSGELCSEKT